MNSPPTPDSPSSSNSDLEELSSSVFQTGPTKRRLGGGSQNPSGPKTRRKEESRRGTWEHGMRGGKEKDDFVDNDFMREIKRDLGDPLLDGFSNVPS
ncbi:hypothetical protein DL96DRAFT_1606579 [Flagelloscypha sp. PMI_526]|nr:hypothetical protein DL96DRAFT_1606579 [Flagelloscypha sp. PMI_526]